MRPGRRVGWIPRIKYLGRASALDSLNPLPKLALLVSVTVTVFILRETWQLAVVLAVVLALFPVARMRLWEVRAASRFFVTFSLLLLLIHALLVHAGPVAAEARLGPLRVVVTWGGLRLGLDMVFRFLVIVLGSFLFVATTEPNALAQSLMRAGLPYRAGFALVLAIRLMPLMRAESSTVRDAQAARGLEIDRGGPVAAVRSVRHTLTPLLVSAMARVDNLVVSMEGRAFGRSRERTFVTDVRWRARDTALLVLVVLLPVLAAVLRWGPWDLPYL